MQKISKKTYWLIFTMILIIQLITIAYFCVEKKSYHVDEIYSYILSNSYDTDSISNAEGYWNTWLNGKDFMDFVTVQEGEQFSYDKVAYNNSLDAHPPLYYFVLHTICSLFPNTFSRWLGLSINIVCFILTQLLLYSLSKRIFGNNLWAIAPIAVYGGTMLGIDTATFARMYMLLALLTILLTYVHYNMWERGVKKSDFIICFVLTFLGTYTQYYFAFIAFFLAAAMCVYLLTKKKWKELTIYAVVMLLAIVCVFIVWPAGITQITGSATNNVGNEVAGNILNFRGWPKAIFYMACNIGFGALEGIIYCKWIVSVVIVAIVLLAIKFRKAVSKDEQVSVAFFVVSIAILFGTVVVISHVTGKFIYSRYIYNIVPLMSLVGTLFVKFVCDKLAFNQQICAAGLILVWLISMGALVKGNLNTYLFEEQAASEQAIIELCEDKPLIVIGNKNETHLPTGNIMILSACNNVYMSILDDFENVDTVLESVEYDNGVVFIVLTDQEWSVGFDGDEVMGDIVESSAILNNYSEFGTCLFSNVYVAK